MNPGPDLPAHPKAVLRAALAGTARAFAREGRALVLTNGCFDILHEGHRAYLADARRLGDALAVALNSDRSVRALKGPGRPVNPLAARFAALAALDCVDFVTAYDEDHVTALLREVRPGLYAKGGDYTLDTVEPTLRAALLETGIPVRFVTHVPGVSTTAILAARRAAAAKESP